MAKSCVIKPCRSLDLNVWRSFDLGARQGRKFAEFHVWSLAHESNRRTFGTHTYCR
jgi:hypothetical protein